MWVALPGLGAGVPGEAGEDLRGGPLPLPHADEGQGRGGADLVVPGVEGLDQGRGDGRVAGGGEAEHVADVPGHARGAPRQDLRDAGGGGAGPGPEDDEGGPGGAGPGGIGTVLDGGDQAVHGGGRGVAAGSEGRGGVQGEGGVPEEGPERREVHGSRGGAEAIEGVHGGPADADLGVRKEEQEPRGHAGILGVEEGHGEDRLGADLGFRAPRRLQQGIEEGRGRIPPAWPFGLSEGRGREPRNLRVGFAEQPIPEVPGLRPLLLHEVPERRRPLARVPLLAERHDGVVGLPPAGGEEEEGTEEEREDSIREKAEKGRAISHPPIVCRMSLSRSLATGS